MSFDFKRPVPAANAPRPPATPPRPAPAPKRQGLFSGRMSFGADQIPLLDEGDYVVRVMAGETKIKPVGAPNAGRPSVHWTILVEWADEGAKTAVGETRNYMALPTTPGGAEDCARFIVSAAGYDDDNEFNADLNPKEDGAFADACAGYATEYSTNGNPIVGRLLWISVSRGKEKKNDAGDTTDWYRRYRCKPVPEEQQDQTPRPAPVAA